MLDAGDVYNIILHNLWLTLAKICWKFTEISLKVVRWNWELNYFTIYLHIAIKNKTKNSNNPQMLLSACLRPR